VCVSRRCILGGAAAAECVCSRGGALHPALGAASYKAMLMVLAPGDTPPLSRAVLYPAGAQELWNSSSKGRGESHWVIHGVHAMPAVCPACTLSPLSPAAR